ncbi:MAG: hypothetical protein HY544_04540 [Candidatus Diapherotrites archaeon]|uniref:Uncharacterized protein n=1 Tax=Candidatus Iainarchaeum sp. TaxID=3101447 RepID=A0A8T3YL28_9ARCH|nr:hypothetical protein [Candidatus Diapherotrites archaeon]
MQRRMVDIIKPFVGQRKWHPHQKDQIERAMFYMIKRAEKEAEKRAGRNNRKPTLNDIALEFIVLRRFERIIITQEFNIAKRKFENEIHKKPQIIKREWIAGLYTALREDYEKWAALPKLRKEDSGEIELSKMAQRLVIRKLVRSIIGENKIGRATDIEIGEAEEKVFGKYDIEVD